MFWLLLLVLTAVLADLWQSIDSGVHFMAQIDDIKAELADIKANQDVAAVAAADLASDVDALLLLVQQGVHLDEIEASVKDIQATAKAQADALTAAAGKFPPAA